MVIKKLSLVNFGCFESRVFTFPTISALIAKNGTGKTTLLNAIRFALTGEEPEGGIIRKGALSAYTGITLVGLTGKKVTIGRERHLGGVPSKFTVNGHTSTAKKAAEMLETATGIPFDKLKVISSSEVVSNLNPGELGNLLLGYIPEKLKRDDIVKMFDPTKLTDGMKAVLEANLDETGLDVAAIEAFNAFCRDERKLLKSERDAKTLVFSEKPQEKPDVDKAAKEARLKELDRIDAEASFKKEKIAAYKKAEEALSKWQANVERLRKEAEGITAVRPDPSKEEELQKAIESSLSQVGVLKGAIESSASQRKQLEKTLAALESSVCPISPLITCHENKTVAKEEITAAIEKAIESENAMAESVKELEAGVEKTKAELATFLEGKKAYEHKVEINKSLRELEDVKPALPEKPEEGESVDTSAERFQIEKALETLKAYNEGQGLKTLIESLDGQIADYDALVKATADKGEVKQGVIRRFLGVFTDTANALTKEVRPDSEFLFDTEKGVTVKFNPGDGNFYNPEELSAGEKAYETFILMEMLNQLSGAGILFVDELSVMDSEYFGSLVRLVNSHKEEFANGHVIISAVNHSDTVAVIEEQGIPVLDLGEKVATPDPDDEEIIW